MPQVYMPQVYIQKETKRNRKKQKHTKRTDTKELRCGITTLITVLRSSVNSRATHAIGQLKNSQGWKLNAKKNTYY